MKIPTIEQLQAWTAQWDQAKPHLSYLKVLDQRLQQASDTEEIRQVVDDLVNPVRQDELGQDPTGVELINDGVDQDEAQDQQTKKIKNTQRAKVFKMIADEHISPLYKELGSAFETLELQPPWSTTNSASGMYRTDEHLMPLSIRMLDGLRQSELSGYKDFSEPGHEYGCTSPISHILMEKNESPENETTNNIYNKKLDEKLDKYVDELAERLTNFRADITEKWSGYLPDGVTLPDTATLKSSVLRDMKALVVNQNTKSLVDIEKAVIQKTTELIGQFQDQDLSLFSQGEVPDFASAFRYHYDYGIKEVFRQFNREKNAERLLSVCYDLAFCAKASESDQSAAHLQALKDSGIKNISGVLRGASTNSASVLFSVNNLDAKSAQRMARIAVNEQSYGALRAALNAIEAKGEQIDKASWSYMAKCALEGNDPSIIRQCLQIKNEDRWIRRSWLEDANQTDPELMHDLLMASLRTDKHYGKMRSNEGRLQILQDAGVNVNLNVKCSDGKTALMWAVSIDGYESAVIQLIKARADINAKSKDGDTALMMACQRQNEKIVSALITAGADIEAKNEKGETALIIACQTDKLKIVSALMRANADVFNQGPGKFPSQYANESSNENITNLVNLEKQRRIDRISQMQRASREASTASNTNATTQGLTELTTAATEIGRQVGFGPSL